VAPGGDLPPRVRERIAGHEGNPLVAFPTAGPDTPLGDVLATLLRLHEAGIRRFHPEFFRGALPPPLTPPRMASRAGE